METTTHLRPNLRRLFALRFSPSIVLLTASFLCLQPVVMTHLPVKIGSWLFFGVSWILPLLAIPIALYQLIRHRSLQHAVEIVLALWLLLKGFDGIVRASA